jgi:hypothetical protein
MTTPNVHTPLRDDNETTTSPPKPTCPICGAPFTPVRRQTYCTNACRQIAWRRRHTPHDPDNATTLPPARSRRDHTIYTCTDCDTRYLAEQWCHDCHRPCRRLGPGGECPCGELLTINELLQGDHMT